MKKLQLTKETLANLSSDEQAQFLQGVNGGMAAPSTNPMDTGCSSYCTVSISWRGTCSANICFPTTNCTL